MTCIRCTALLDYVLVSASKQILPVPLLYLILFLFVFFCCLLFTLPFVHSFVSCIFCYFFFPCENKYSSKKNFISIPTRNDKVELISINVLGDIRN